MHQVADRLRTTVGIAYPLLCQLDREAVTRDPYPPEWSKIQILGHLIDSACNNQMKFVRGTQQAQTHIVGYAQNHWVDVQGYQQSDWQMLADLWRLYNLHLADVIERAPASVLGNTLVVAGPQGDTGPFTLEFVMNDYIEHMKHHLLQILPGAPLNHSFKNVYFA